MIRSAVLTLGGFCVLVGGCAAQADQLSLADWPFLAPTLPSTTELFPRLPDNWNDLPFQLHINETAGYNSNILNTPTGIGVSRLYGKPIGAMQSISTYGASFKHQWGAHQFFGDASWGMYRYLNNSHYNSAHSNLDIGDNFTYGSHCKGTVKASETSAPSQPGQQLATNVVNTVTTTALTENAQCIINGNYSGILNSGTTTQNNSALIDKQNNYQSVFVAAGINYAVTETNSLQILATITGYDYTDRYVVSTRSGLVRNLTSDQIMATYSKDFGPNLVVNAQFGLIGIRDSYFSMAFPRTVLPQYSFSAQWSATPKLSLNAAVSRLASPPTSIISNLQITEAASAGFTYRWTPKLSLGGSLQASYITGATTLDPLSALLTTYTQNQRGYTAGLKLDYVLTPFVTSHLSYQVTKTVQSDRTTDTSLILLALDFNPY